LSSRRIVVVAAFTALAVASGAYVAGHFRISVDVARFLADAREKDLGAVATRLTGSAQARTILLGVEGPDLETALRAARAWSGPLAQHPEVAEVHAGPDPGIERALFDLYFPRRLDFLTPSPERELPEQLSDAGLREAARRLREALAAPEGAWIKGFAGADPLLAYPAQLRRIEAVRTGSLRVQGGQFVGGEPARAILLLTTVHSPFDSTAQAPLLEHVATSFAELNRGFGGSLHLTQSGAHRFAVESERQAKADAAWLSGISLVLLVVSFYALYRSLAVLVLSLIPLALGLLAATAATLAWFGELHALTLAFGGTLIGICTDYPLHLLTHFAMRDAGTDARTVVRRLRTPLAMASGTTALGFLALASADLPGIREVGVFAIVGVGVALLSTLWLVPELIPGSIRPTRALVRLAEWLRTRMHGGRPGVALAAAAATVAVCAVGLPRLRWDDDVFALNVPLRSDWVREDGQLRKAVSQAGMERLAVAIAADDEAALRLDDQVSARLRAAQADGALDGFASLHAFTWSGELQARNRRALDAEPQVAERLGQAFAAEGFRPEAFGAFAQALASPPPAPLTTADLLDSPLRPAVAPFRVELADGRVALLTTLRGVHDGDAVARALAGLDGVYLYDAKRFASELYARYRARSLWVVAAGAAAVVGMLALRYRRLDEVCVAAAPALLAAVATLALLALAGVTASLLHLLGVLLVLCLGVDYGIFLVESRREGGHDDAASLVSVAIDCLTTLLSFGLLAASSFPALSALGTSTSVGICLSLLLVLSFRAALPDHGSRRGGEG
jgi:predicted exporter